MHRLMLPIRALLLAALALLAIPGRAALSPDKLAEKQPVAPFKIIGNIYYVGASDLTSKTSDVTPYLIATSQGLILLDSGLTEDVPTLAANIAALGFKPGDIKVLLNSHAHFDHAGGLAALKRMTHASLAASAADAALMADGGKGDFFFGDSLAYEPVRADRILKDGDQVRLGGTVMTAHLTPGHTRGCTTWSMQVMEDGKPHDVVFLCSVSVPAGYRLVDNAQYPGIASDYARSFVLLRSLPCDVFLGAHGSYYGLADKLARMRRHEPGNPFIDPQGYRDFLAGSEQAFERELAEQQSKTKH